MSGNVRQCPASPPPRPCSIDHISPSMPDETGTGKITKGSRLLFLLFFTHRNLKARLAQPSISLLSEIPRVPRSSRTLRRAGTTKVCATGRAPIQARFWLEWEFDTGTERPILSSTTTPGDPAFDFAAIRNTPVPHFSRAPCAKSGDFHRQQASPPRLDDEQQTKTPPRLHTHKRETKTAPPPSQTMSHPEGPRFLQRAEGSPCTLPPF